MGQEEGIWGSREGVGTVLRSSRSDILAQLQHSYAVTLPSLWLFADYFAGHHPSRHKRDHLHAFQNVRYCMS